MPNIIKNSTIFVADDEPYICELFCDLLEPSGATVKTFNSGSSVYEAIEQAQPDLAIFDVRMPAPDGLALLKMLREQNNTIPVLIVTAQESSSVTIEAMQHGAYDYIAKPFDPDNVLSIIERALEHGRLSRDAHSNSVREKGKSPQDALIGKSAAMQQVYKMIGRVASSDATILITGESGTGKEVVANVIHQASPRSAGPFIAVNCAALPETLLESELFGHEKGAFTGAVAQRKGRFEQAKGGTIFLDEIGEVSPATQKKLLRVLQERTFERVGGNVSVKADVRVLAATNLNLLQEVAEARFREDLYYRLNVIAIELPPLRERRDDIPLLVDYFLEQTSRRTKVKPAQITPEAQAALTQFHWPGNVRQLENSIERAVVLSQSGLIETEHLYLVGGATQINHTLLTQALNDLLSRGDTLETMMTHVRKRAIELALQTHSNDHATTARMLAISEEELEQGLNHV